MNRKIISEKETERRTGIRLESVTGAGLRNNTLVPDYALGFVETVLKSSRLGVRLEPLNARRVIALFAQDSNNAIGGLS